MEENSVTKEMLVEKIKNYVELHHAEELSLDKIAAELNYSKFYMERVFAEITGMTIYKYIQACRLDVAAEQLARTNRPIIDIALEAGYNSPQAFTQAFRRMYLCPPRVYRKNGAYCPEKVEMFGCRGKDVRRMVYRGRVYANGTGQQEKTVCKGIDQRKTVRMGIYQGKTYADGFKLRGKSVHMGTYRTRIQLLRLFTVGRENAEIDQYGGTWSDYLSASGFQEGRWAA